MFVIVAGIMGALGLMILFMGFLTTGVTREKVYRAWRAQISGRISCIVVRIKVDLYNFNLVQLQMLKYTVWVERFPLIGTRVR